ncbi:ParB/RepB/Spo0J family partition protein [Methylocystis sp. S23]
MNRRNLALDKLFVPETRIRTLDRAWAEAIAANMAERGQLQPILVRQEGERFRVIAGEHRYEGAKMLGWTMIDCSVVGEEVSDEELELYEIDENLFRNDLSPLERDISLARRKELYERLSPNAATHGGDRKSKRQNVALIAFSKDAARKTGLNKRTIERSVARIRNLAPEVIAALRGSPIADNASEIEALSKMPRDQQIKIAGAIARGTKTLLNARKAVGLAPALPDPTDAAYAKIEAAWARAPKAAREKFLDAILPTWRKLKVTIEEPAPKASDAPANDDEAGDEE